MLIDQEFWYKYYKFKQSNVLKLNLNNINKFVYMARHATNNFSMHKHILYNYLYKRNA